MQLTVKGKHLDVGDALRSYVQTNLSHTASKYFRNPIDATVIFTKEKDHLYRADISVHLGGGVVLQAQHEADDPYPAFDVAAKHVAARLARYKDKVRDHHRWEEPLNTHIASYTTFEANENESAGAPVTIAEMQTQVSMLAVADAVMRLELGDLPALMFKNPKHGGMNMVYRRKDGNIGWVDPVDSTSGAKKAPAKLVKAAAKKPAPSAKKSKQPARKAVKVVVRGKKPVVKAKAKPIVKAKAKPIVKAKAKPVVKAKPLQKKKKK
jgi:ribosomal subunit interface protein